MLLAIQICLLILLPLLLAQDPSCLSSKCPENCWFHGKCHQDSCQCDFGYEGSTCSARTCDRSICDFGTCMNDGSCSCEVGYIGERCDRLIGVQPWTMPVFDFLFPRENDNVSAGLRSEWSTTSPTLPKVTKTHEKARLLNLLLEIQSFRCIENVKCRMWIAVRARGLTTPNAKWRSQRPIQWRSSWVLEDRILGR